MRLILSNLYRLGVARSADPNGNDLEIALRDSWSAATSAEPESWNPANPAKGQCAVSALIIQDHLGGQLVRAETAKGSHYWNRLPDGTEIDITRDQFTKGELISPGEERGRAYVLSFPATRVRYRHLRRAVAQKLRPSQ